MPKEADLSDESTTTQPTYRANDFVQDAFSVKITPFQLDNHATEWQEFKRAQNAHILEVESLRQSNRSLTTQLFVHCHPEFYHISDELHFIGAKRRTP